MAEQSHHDVVNQTRSDGDPSPSDVPASTSSNQDTGGDVKGVTTKNQLLSNAGRQLGSSDSENTTTGSSGTSGTTQGSSNEGNYQPNGVSASESGYDSNAQFNVGEGSAGSDTDTSRTDPKANNERQHSRKNSVKKPTSFKPVSFAKFSLAKSPGAAQSLKPAGDKSSTSSSSTTTLQQTSRPRLVAKSAGSLRESTPKPASVASKNGSGGPDPNQVWNKNRPQPPPSKHLTDEELKQQYGIHMTSRILDEGESKEAKWADIDDDEDDWAPDTIEWNDGTKITLAHNDTMSAASHDAKDLKNTQESSAPPAERQSSREPPKVIAPKPTSVGPNATVFRLGASSDRNQTKAGGIQSKTPAEKPTLTSKSSTPKSPWAALPPVEKVSPIPNTPQQHGHPNSRFIQKDHSVDQSSTVAPTKEIAADDFNRSWRDSQSGFPRELYNSQSGRYEPAPETRRGSTRHEHGRGPSLLQRPPPNDQSGPAEPSAAFQTHRSTPHQDAGPWARRRTSSNVSGGSGGFGRRMSHSRPDVPGRSNESIPPRRGSQVNGLLERSISPRGAQNQKGPYAPRGISPGQKHLGPNDIPPGSQGGPPAEQTSPAPDDSTAQPQIPEEDPVAMQQRIMREKREMARQRRLEAEAKEEAARKERIRLKLEALGPPSEKAKPQETPKAETPKQATTTPATVHSPPKPPVPEPSGEPKQYGMMKVHHPESVKKLVAAHERVPDKSLQGHGQARRAPSPVREAKSEQDATSTAPSTNGVQKSPDTTGPPPAEAHQELSTDEKNSQWKSPGYAPNGYSSWVGPKLGTPGTSSLWGPPSNDKALGNGTFDRNLTGFPPRDLSSRNHLAISEQLPIAPPSSSSAGSERRSLPFSGSSRVDNGPSLSPLPSPDKRHAVPNTSDRIKPIARPGPIAPPTSHPPNSRWRQDQLTQRPEIAAWQNFHATAARVEAEENEKFQREFSARREEEARTGVSRASLQTNFSETWRQVDVGDKSGQRQVIGTTKTTDVSAPLSPLHGLGATVDGLSLADAPNKPIGNSVGRGSRFFPNHTEQQKRSAGHNDQFPRSPSPPPPEEVTSHPVFTGDAQRPLVHFPGPKPVVKLPPRRATTPPPPATFASMVASGPSLRVVAQPIANTTSWQDRFNGLFGKKSPPQKTNVLEVTSATKEPLEVQPDLAPAAVSLPQHEEYERRNAGEVTSKNVEDEEEMFEDREAGSLPVVKVPDIPLNRSSWETPLPQSHIRLRSKYLKPAQVLSIEPYVFNLSETANGVSIAIRLPGKDSTKNITLPRKGGNGSQNRGRGTSNMKSRKGGKPRENPGKNNNSQNPKKHPGTPSHGNTSSSRPAAGRGNWTPRATGVAH